MQSVANPYTTVALLCVVLVAPLFVGLGAAGASCSGYVFSSAASLLASAAICSMLMAGKPLRRHSV